MQEMKMAEIDMVNGGGNAMIGRVADSLAAAALPALVFGPEASAAFLLVAGGFYAVNAFM